MANKDYKPTGTGAFAPVAELSQPVDYLDTVFHLKGYNLPTANSLADGMAAMIEDEIVQVRSYGVGTCTVTRGCADTVPAQHPVDALIWWLDTTTGTDKVEYAGGDEVSVKQTPYTIGGGKLPMAAAPPDDLKMNWRFFRPYAPGLMMAKSQHWFVPATLSSTSPNLTLTWKDRDRIIEADQLVDHLAGNIGPEPGTTYIMRVYDANDVLVRTEVGIIGVTNPGPPPVRVNSFTYTWQQAMTDLGFAGGSGTDVVQGKIHFCSHRDNFDSWQDYTIHFTVDTTGNFMRVAQFATMAAQPTDDSDSSPTDGVMSAQLMTMAAQEPSADSEPDVDTVVTGMMVAGVQSSAGQLTSFYTPINRNLFESPYTFNARKQQDPEGEYPVTVAARPSDRLTDTHVIRARPDWPAGSGSVLPFNDVSHPSFTPWFTLDVALQYIETTALIRTSSFYDGVPISNVPVGSLALVGAEIVRVDGFSPDGTQVVLARGCCDTVPAKHAANTRVWFFEAMSGFDPTGYSWNEVTRGAAAEIKMVPAVYGPALANNEVPSDRVNMKRRAVRPLPPGRVMVNDRPWFEGAQTQPDLSTIISWVGRNRLTQGAAVIDHSMADQGVENLQQHRLRMQIVIPSTQPNVPPNIVTIRDAVVDGNQFEYTYEMAQSDGYKAGRMLNACGYVSVAIVLTAIREDLAATVGDGRVQWLGADQTQKHGFESWQGYSILLRLPSYACAPGQPPGGGQQGDAGLPNNGNGDTGSSTPGNPGSGDNHGGPTDPVDNGGDADNGDGPPEQPTPPPDWPDPVEPTPQPKPDDPNPELSAHWDTNWDRHWDAYTADDIGGNN